MNMNNGTDIPGRDAASSVEDGEASKSSSMASAGGADLHPESCLLGMGELMAISWRLTKEKLHKLVSLSIFSYIIILVVIIFWALIAHVLSSTAGLAICGIGLLASVSVCWVWAGAAYVIQMGGSRELRLRESIRQAYLRLGDSIRAVFFSLAIFADVLLPLLLISIAYAILSVSIMAVGGGSQLALALINVASWLLGISVFSLLLIPLSILMYVWAGFFFFAILLDKLALKDAAGYAFGILKRHKLAVMWRLAVFAVLYLIVLILVERLAQLHWMFSFLLAVANLVLGTWLAVFFYSIYDNLKRICGRTIDAADRSLIDNLMHIGTVLLILLSLPYMFILIMTVVSRFIAVA